MPLSVLIVDDAADIRLLIRGVLEEDGFVVHEAASGPDGLRLLERGMRPDAIVLDVQMPEMDGWDTLAAIRRAPRTDVPVLLCSVKSKPDDVARGWALGCDGYIVKPFDIHTLVDQIRTATARSAEERALLRDEMVAVQRAAYAQSEPE